MRENQLDRAGEAACTGRSGGSGTRSCGRTSSAIGRSRRRLLDEPLVLVRLGGEVRAFKDLCVHRGTALSLGWVEDGCLVCPYHGWTYDPDGVCTRIPSSHGTNIPRKARIGGRGGRARRADLGLPRATRRRRRCRSRSSPSGATRRTGRSRSRSTTGTAAPRGGSRTSSTSATSPGSTRGSWAIDSSPRSRTTTSTGPTHAVVPARASRSRPPTSRATPARGADPARAGALHDLDAVHRAPGPAAPGRPPLRAVRRVVPGVREGDPQLHLERPELRAGPGRDQGFVDFQQVILEQDRVVVESQRPEELPIDLSEELHIKGVDRVSIDYRRWLGEIAAR